MAPSSSLTYSHSQAGQDNNNNINNNNSNSNNYSSNNHSSNNNDSSLQGIGAGAGTNSHHNPSESARPQPGTSAWQHSPDALTSSSSPSSSAYKRMSHPTTGNSSTNSSSQHYSNRQEHPTPLSIALPLSNSRPTTNGSSSHHHNNGPSGGSFSAGYLDQRRDTFPSLTHHNHHSNHTNGHSNGNGYSNNSSVSWQTYSSANNIHDDTHHNHHTHHPQPMRPQSISYATHQLPLQLHLHNQHQQSSHHAASPTTPISASLIDQDPTNTAAIMRRRRLSTASTSSKRGAGSSNNLRSQKAPNTPHHTRRFTTLISDQEPDTTYLWGYLLFFCTMVGFTVSMYALVASNYMPLTGNKTLDWIKKDSHYCMLVPVTIPVTVLFVLFNWLGMKLFRHN